MRRRLLAAVTAVLALAGAQVAEAKQRPQDRLNAYTAVVDAGGLAKIAEAGFDVAEGTRQVRGGTEVDLIMTADQRDKATTAAITMELCRFMWPSLLSPAWRRVCSKAALSAPMGRQGSAAGAGEPDIALRRPHEELPAVEDVEVARVAFDQLRVAEDRVDIRARVVVREECTAHATRRT